MQQFSEYDDVQPGTFKTNYTVQMEAVIPP
jgi:hypothetical protein